MIGCFVIRCRTLIPPLIGLALVGGASPAVAEEKPWSAELSGGLYSHYMFRGFELYDGLSFQPCLCGEYRFNDWGRVGGSLWAHFPIADSDDTPKFIELDETLYVGFDLGTFDLSVGHIWYTFPSDPDDGLETAEVYGSLSVDVPLSPTVTVYYDYQEFDAGYAEINVSHDIEVGDGDDPFVLSPFLTLGFGYSADEIYDESEGLALATYGVSGTWMVGEVSISPMIAYSVAIDDATVARLWGGVSASFSF